MATTEHFVRTTDDNSEVNINVHNANHCALQVHLPGVGVLAQLIEHPDGQLEVMLFPTKVGLRLRGVKQRVAGRHITLTFQKDGE